MGSKRRGSSVELGLLFEAFATLMRSYVERYLRRSLPSVSHILGYLFSLISVPGLYIVMYGHSDIGAQEEKKRTRSHVLRIL